MKYQVSYAQDHCTGCLRCRLACSGAYAKQFQPSAAHIAIHTRGIHYAAEFRQECTACGLCADSCLFGALIKYPMESAA
jgi:ferredoxin